MHYYVGREIEYNEWAYAKWIGQVVEFWLMEWGKARNNENRTFAYLILVSDDRHCFTYEACNKKYVNKPKSAGALQR